MTNRKQLLTYIHSLQNTVDKPSIKNPFFLLVLIEVHIAHAHSCLTQDLVLAPLLMLIWLTIYDFRHYLHDCEDYRHSFLHYTFETTISVLHEGVSNGPLRLVQREVIVLEMGALVKCAQVQNVQIGSLRMTTHKSRTHQLRIPTDIFFFIINRIKPNA